MRGKSQVIRVMQFLKSYYILLFLPFFFVTIYCSNKPLEKVFTDIFKSNVWAYESETVSGVGASLHYTENMRKELSALIKKYNIKTILDMGCGDFNWMKHVISDDITYIGMDVVKEIIENNSAKYATHTISFIHDEVSTAQLPRVDLIICRDIIPHLSYQWAMLLLKNIKQSGSKYVLLTTYGDEARENKNLTEQEIGVANYPVTMQKLPFNLGEPLDLFNENCPYPYFGITPDKVLGLWDAEDLDKGPAAVTYLDNARWGGRLGDFLLMYIKAKWVSYKYELRLYYKPFKYSDQFMMHDLENRWYDDYITRYTIIEDPYQGVAHQKSHSVDLEQFINPFLKKLHIIHYYFQPKSWGEQQARYDSQDVGEWVGLYEDTEFRTILREMLKPRIPVKKLELPVDRITVAVHVRKGGGYDGEMLSLQLYSDQEEKPAIYCACSAFASYYTDVGYTLKFPPDQFYVEQIRYLSKKYNDMPMYVHLFTDDRDPQALIDKYAAAVDKPNITYGCRQKGNHYDCNVIDDLFNMVRFDCFIRSGSNFPQVAQLLGNFKVVLYPRHAQWRSMLHIYDVGMKTEQDFLMTSSVDNS